MERQNQRIMLKKQLIHTAFLRLLRNKGIREISIERHTATGFAIYGGYKLLRD